MTCDCPVCGHPFNPSIHAKETDPVGVVHCPNCKSRLELRVTIGGYSGRAAGKVRREPKETDTK